MACNSKIYNVFLSVLIAALVGSGPAAAWQSSAQQGTVDPSRDVRAKGPTADNAKNDKADLRLAQKVRRAIVADKSLSTAAHNVKVIAINGAVTLRGPVRSEEEKRAVEAKAAEVAGAGKITNELTVSASNTHDKEAQKKESKTKQ